MKSHTEYLVFDTKKRREMVHITDEVEQIVQRSGVRDGLCFVSPMHITAAVYVNDLESGLIEDIGKWLEELAPARPDYKHHRTGEDNGDAHLKALLLHHETTLPVTNGKLDLGTWQPSPPPRLHFSPGLYVAIRAFSPRQGCAGLPICEFRFSHV
jgi:secondary thiamine-phosphate synthase enzyme